MIGRDLLWTIVESLVIAVIFYTLTKLSTAIKDSVFIFVTTLWLKNLKGRFRQSYDMSFGDIQNPIAKVTSAALLIGVGIATVLGQVPEGSLEIATILIGASAGFLFGTSVSPLAK